MTANQISPLTLTGSTRNKVINYLRLGTLVTTYLDDQACWSREVDILLYASSNRRTFTRRVHCVFGSSRSLSKRFVTDYSRHCTLKLKHDVNI